MLNIELAKKLVRRFQRMRHPNHFRMAQIAIKTDCGAAMCLIGHTLDLAGFKMRKKKYLESTNLSRTEGCRSDYDFLDPKSGVPISDPFDKAEQLLGLGNETARYLFHDYSLRTPKQAATKIQQLIEQSKKGEL